MYSSANYQSASARSQELSTPDVVDVPSLERHQHRRIRLAQREDLLPVRNRTNTGPRTNSDVDTIKIAEDLVAASLRS